MDLHVLTHSFPSPRSSDVGWGGACRGRCVPNGAESALTRALGATSPACGRGAPTVANVICGGEDAGQDVAGVDRGALGGVAEEDTAGAGGDGFRSAGGRQGKGRGGRGRTRGPANAENKKQSNQ